MIRVYSVNTKEHSIMSAYAVCVCVYRVCVCAVCVRTMLAIVRGQQNVPAIDLLSVCPLFSWPAQYISVGVATLRQACLAFSLFFFRVQFLACQSTLGIEGEHCMLCFGLCTSSVMPWIWPPLITCLNMGEHKTGAIDKHSSTVSLDHKPWECMSNGSTGSECF